MGRQAGIRRSRGTAEQLGVDRTRKSLETSEIVLHVCDASKRLTSADQDIMSSWRGKHAILVLNKSDLPQQLRLPAEMASRESVHVSALRGDGLDVLRNKLVAIAYSGTVGTADVDVAINERHTAALESAYEFLTESCHMLKTSEPLEIVSQPLRRSLDCLGEIVGKTSTDDILDRIFSTFCIGK